MDKVPRSVFYQSKIDQFSEIFEQQKKKMNRIALLRLLVFLAIIFVLFWLIPNAKNIAFGSAVFLFLVFVFLVKLYFKSSQKKSECERLIWLNKAELSAVEGSFSEFDAGKEFIDTKHAFASDLDIFGNHSIFQYLNRTISPNGKELLAFWLANPSKEKTNIEQKQAAIKELSGQQEWRQKFYATAMQVAESKEEINKLFQWVKTPLTLKKSFVFRVLSFVFPIIAIAVFIIAMIGKMPYSALGVAIVLNLILLSGVVRKINIYFSLISKKVNILKKYARLVKMIEDAEVESSYLKKLKKDLEVEDVRASKRIQQLQKLLGLFEYRLNMLVGMIVNAMLVWDIHIVFAIEKWRKRNEHLLLKWLKVIDEFEALNSLGTFAFNHPAFVYPTIQEDEYLFEAEQLGHPLINEKLRVDNDLLIRNKQQFFVITGGNMAGKSTFLRTVGVNLVLAMNGAPVCAKKFIFKPVDIHSSMRTSDSLAQSESYFFAEISKLKAVLDQLKKGREVFVLLDEILKGTNSTDQQQGSMAFLKQMKNYNGVGLIATHDLSLGKLADEYPDHFQNKCFEVAVRDEQLVFDYLLTDGIAQNLNASFLMKQMGIIVD